MALTDEMFQKHLNAARKSLKRQYNHFKPFDDPDRGKNLIETTQHSSKSFINELSLENIQQNGVDQQLKINKLNISNHSYNHQTNETQSKHKANTNSTPSNHKVDTNVTQIEYNIDTNLTQMEHKYDPKYDTNIDTNLTHLSDFKININTIVGNQRKLLFYIYDLCKIQGSKVTPPLNIESIHNNAFIEKGSIKTSLNRLIKKKFLIRNEVKTGRSGWVVFRLPDPVYTELFNNDLSTSLTQTRHKVHTEGNTKPNTNNSVVSSSYINTTTTSIPDDFKKIDYSALIEIGFDESHIIQIHREYIQKPEITLSADIIQNSINALAFDLKYNNIVNDLKRPPAVFLTSLLKKGQPYSSKTPEKVLTPQEEAMKKYVLAEEKKNNYIIEIETKMKALTLQEWLDRLTEEELLGFNQDGNVCPQGMPEKIYQISKRKKAIESAKDYFNTIIWSKRKKEILADQIK